MVSRSAGSAGRGRIRRLSAAVAGAEPAVARRRAHRRAGAVTAAFAVLLLGPLAAGCGPTATTGGPSFIGGSATTGLSPSTPPAPSANSASPSSALPTGSPSPTAAGGSEADVPTGQSTGDATAPPVGTSDASASLPTPSGLSTADETDVPDGHAVCNAVSADDLQTIFGAPVATKPDRTLASCQFSGGGAQMAVSVYDADSDGLFTIAGQKKSENGGQDMLIAGHPAVLTGDDNLCVSRSTSPSGGGILKIYGLWDAQEVQIGQALAEKIIPHFAVPADG